MHPAGQERAYRKKPGWVAFRKILSRGTTCRGGWADSLSEVGGKEGGDAEVGETPAEKLARSGSCGWRPREGRYPLPRCLPQQQGPLEPQDLACREEEKE